MKVRKQTILWAVVIFLAMLMMHCITKIAMAHLDVLVFSERQTQLQEVVQQYFHSIDLLTDQSWEIALGLKDRIEVEDVSDGKRLQNFLNREDALQRLDEEGFASIAIRSDGQYIDANGWHGAIGDIAPLIDCGEKVSYIYEQPFTGRLYNLYVYRLENPIQVTEGGNLYSIAFVGVCRTMESMNQYFKSSAYGGDNSTYILDRYGGKQYVDTSNMNILKGHNVYSVLREEADAEGRDFDAVLAELESTGTAYSDTYVDGQQCFYALRKMPNTDYVIVYVNPADRVATSTEALVNLVIRAFSIVIVVVTAGTLLVAAWIVLQNRKQLVRETRSKERLEALNQKLDRTNLELQEASRAKSNFLANMSHDIRTPMNAIVGITKLMEHEKNDPEKMDAYIHKVQSSSNHLLSLINDVLDMSKIETGEVTLNREPISLADQMGQIESMVRPQIGERGQTLDVRTHGIVHEHLVGDAVRLRQIIINLLSNAIKYTPNGGRIQFDLAEIVSKDPDYAQLVITVTDNGYGMTPEFVAHIYEAFTRAENSMTNKVQGTGLGMAITKSIVDLMGGTITVKSEVNKGSSFRVELPLLIDKDAALEIDAKEVLLVTWAEDVLENAKASFRNAGLNLYMAGTAKESVSILQQQKIDTVLLSGYLYDPHLPDMVRLIRQEAQNPVLIFCVDYAQQEQVTGALRQSGADGLISRPFFLTNFARVVDQARGDLAETEAEEGAVFNGLRFLCAEDNTLNAEILSAILDMNNATCVIYPDGQQLVDAFASVKPGDFDAILMDVQMPVMNGLDATRAIRHGENPLGKTIPIIAMTANAFSEDVQNCLDAGMNAHVAKPLDIGALERTLKSVLGGKFSGGGTPVRH